MAMKQYFNRSQSWKVCIAEESCWNYHRARRFAQRPVFVSSTSLPKTSHWTLRQ